MFKHTSWIHLGFNKILKRALGIIGLWNQKKIWKVYISQIEILKGNTENVRYWKTKILH